MNDHTELKELAEDMKGWDKMSQCWPSEENSQDWQVGCFDEEENRWPLLTVDSGQYDQEQDAPKIAKYYAAANPATILALIAENERLTTQVRLAGVSAEVTVHQEVGRAITETLAVTIERDQLQAENEAPRNALMECTNSLQGEMLQKFGGQLPEDMHPVTRREYDRDIAEVSGYRAAMGKGEQS